jgi:hypothetical protein
MTRCSKNTKQKRLYRKIRPDRGFKFSKVLGPLLRAAASGLLEGACKLLKGLALALILTLGNNATEKCLCHNASCLGAAHQQHPKPDVQNKEGDCHDK